jgi:hypothetical protein
MSDINITTDAAFDAVHSDLADSLEKHCPAGTDLAVFALGTVEKLYLFSEAQYTLGTIKGVAEFGRENDATYCAFVINDVDYEDPSHLLDFPVFFDAQGNDMTSALDASDYEDDPRISDWIASNREEWIINTLVLDLCSPDVQAKTGHSFTLGCA